MISKTIGLIGVHNIFRQSAEYVEEMPFIFMSQGALLILLNAIFVGWQTEPPLKHGTWIGHGTDEWSDRPPN